MVDIQTASVGESGKCIVHGCDADAEMAAVCDTGQIKHYCEDDAGGRYAGAAGVEEWREL